jgi:Fic family protein
MSNLASAIGSVESRRFDRPDVLKALAGASRALAELKGVVASIPNQSILINTLALQEAKDSSAIENIVTTHDELFRDAAYPARPGSAAAKEILRYREAVQTGFALVKDSGVLTTNHILQIQSTLEMNNAGFRRLPGTTLKDSAGRVVYTPPQDPQVIIALMSKLERDMNDDQDDGVDPLIRMALLHHQFESIHPFYDGNGRTGRIVNVLYLIKSGLLDIPVLYMSRHIVRTKPRYYQLLQSVRDGDTWEEWVVYMLNAVESTARDGIATVQAIGEALGQVKQIVRGKRKFYSQDLINSLFSHPYTTIQFLEHDLRVSRLTATKYLNALTTDGVLENIKVGRSSYYINTRLTAILIGDK